MRTLIENMGSQLSRSARGIACVVIALIALLALSAASATGARERGGDSACTWGASSMTATVVDGRVVTSPPATSGCIPR
jgi:hypothetical protein